MSILRNTFLSIFVTTLLSAGLYAADNSDQLAEAQKKLEEAAREYAELSSELGGDAAAHIVQSFRFSGDEDKKPKARIGINIGEIKIVKNENDETSSSSEKVDGVMVHGVSPDGPAEKAGLKAGDVITSLNGQTLIDNDESSAVKQLVDIMQDVNPGDSVSVLYQREGVTQSASVTTDEMPKHRFNMMFDDKTFDFKGPGDFNIDIQGLEGLKGLEGLESLKNLEVLKGLGQMGDGAKFIFLRNSPLGDAELAELTPELGEYFGTDEGLLVVKAPSDESIELRDGDVIRSIDGREPSSVNNAMRILKSYEAGDEVELEILRKKRKRKVSLTIPERPEKPEVKKWRFEKNSDDGQRIEKRERVKVIKGQETT